MCCEVSLRLHVEDFSASIFSDFLKIDCFRALSSILVFDVQVFKKSCENSG